METKTETTQFDNWETELIDHIKEYYPNCYAEYGNDIFDIVGYDTDQFLWYECQHIALSKVEISDKNENWESELENLTSEIFDLCKSYSFATCNY